jgi:hypothetical protein
MYKVLKNRELNGALLASVGQTVHEWTGNDFGLASLETFMFQKPFLSVSKKRSCGPFFTIPYEDLERIDS